MDIEDKEGFERYLTKERRLGERTVKVYMIFYNLFEPESLSQEYINNFILDHHNTTIVRAFIKHYLIYQGVPDSFRLPQRASGKKPQRIVRSISEKELKIVSEYFHNSSFTKGLLFDMLYQGAMRRVEIITIRLGSFFWKEWFEEMNNFCRLVILGKGKKQRIVLINPETANSIFNHFKDEHNLDTEDKIMTFFKNNKDALLFSTEEGKEMTEKQIYDIIKKLSFKAIQRDIRPHELRHCRATELEKRGVSLRDIRSYLGHTKLATTEIYLHKSGEESLDAIEEKLTK